MTTTPPPAGGTAATVEGRVRGPVPDAGSVLERLGGVAGTGALRAAGVTSDRVLRRVRRGEWALLAPGVVCGRDLADDLGTRLRGALLAASHPRAALSHHTALACHGVLPLDGSLHVAVPHGHRVRANGLVTVHQARELPPPVLLGGLPVCPLPVALAQASAALGPVDLRGAVVAAVQEHGAPVGELAALAARARGCGSALLRLAVEEVLGSRSPAEGVLYRGCECAGLALPELNGRVETRDGPRFVDLLWRRLRFGVEVDGRRWHLDPVRWTADLARANALLAAGVVLLRFPAARVLGELDAVVAEIGAALQQRAAELGVR